MPKEEHHRLNRSGWLRASVLGANDGIVSTSSLIIGMISAEASHGTVMVAGAAGLISGAISMAAGEYVSVCSQADIEASDLELERKSIEENFHEEEQELAEIYMARGLDEELARKVAKQLMENSALESHARDEIGISSAHSARPVLAAFSSGLSFVFGAAFPLLALLLGGGGTSFTFVSVSSLFFLALLGCFSAFLTGASYAKSVMRIVFWGVFAMTCTALVGRFFNYVIA